MRSVWLVVLAVIIGNPTRAAPSPKPPRTAAPSAAERAAYKKHMKAGWALQKQQRWADAVAEFEAALAAIDGDERAFAELGQSAMAAGDFAKARRADEQAAQVAADKKVKAAALYNLGVVLEKTGDSAGALRAYQGSLALRPNQTVADAIAHLGATPATVPPFCAAGKQPCDCVRAVFAGGDDDATCTLAASPVPGFRLYHAEHAYHFEQNDYLLDEHDQLAAIIGGGFEYRGGAEFDELKLDKAEVTSISGHRVAWLQTTETFDETGNGDDPSMTSSRTTRVTLCVLGSAASPTRCPLRDAPIDQAPDADNAKTETKLDLSIANDGTATLRLVSGPSDEQITALVGPHKLW